MTSSIPILIVEDSPVYAEILQRLLPSLEAARPFEVRCVPSAEQAQAALAERDYQLVLLDYKLPGADGLEMLGMIRQQAPERQPAVVMLTGMGNENVAVAAMKQGAKDYLAKDQLDVASLTRAINCSLERKRLEDQVAITTRALREKNEELQADLTMAREIQQALLPQSFPTLPPGAGAADSALAFVSRYHPTGTVGGDFFDVHALSETEVGVFISDVMGHGVRAALVTAILRALVEELRPRSHEPGSFLTALSSRLLRILRQTRRPMFVSAFYLVLDARDGQIRFANAGHPSPLWVRRAQGSVAPLGGDGNDGAGPALGVFEDARYPTNEEQLAPRDLVLLHTDGVFEVANQEGEHFGEERLAAAVQARLQQPAAALCDELLATIRGFSTAEAFVDDVCLVAMELKRLLEPRSKP